MNGETTSTKNVGELFSQKWWGDKVSHREVYDDLVAKLQDHNHKVKCTPPIIVNRSFLACEYIIKNVAKGSRVLDMACGLGFNTCCLRTCGYQAEGFDLSEKQSSVPSCLPVVLVRTQRCFPLLT